MTTVQCQLQSKDAIHDGPSEFVLLSKRTRMIMTVANLLPINLKIFMQNSLKRIIRRQAGKNNSIVPTPRAIVKPAAGLFTAGVTVQVRCVEEIHATLNTTDRLHGCKFMPEMEQYCGTTQRVFKPVERFVNERDYTVRKSSGLVLLENLFCQGFAGVGRCDRSCFYFWRVEWLEVLETKDDI